jgi:hypothetical protein
MNLEGHSFFLSNLYVFLEKISFETEKFKSSLRERLLESNEVLFSKKTVDACIEEIKNMKDLDFSSNIKSNFFFFYF